MRAACVFVRRGGLPPNLGFTSNLVLLSMRTTHVDVCWMLFLVNRSHIFARRA